MQDATVSPTCCTSSTNSRVLKAKAIIHAQIRLFMYEAGNKCVPKYSIMLLYTAYRYRAIVSTSSGRSHRMGAWPHFDAFRQQFAMMSHRSASAACWAVWNGSSGKATQLITVYVAWITNRQIQLRRNAVSRPVMPVLLLWLLCQDLLEVFCMIARAVPSICGYSNVAASSM